METGTTVTAGTVSKDVLDQFPGLDVGENVSVPSIFTNDKDLSFIDKPGAVERAAGAAATPGAGDDDKDKGAGAAAAAPAAQAKPINQTEADKILNQTPDAGAATDDDDDADDKGDGAAGGKKTGRDGITSYLKGKIEAGDFFTFDDYDEKKETLEAYLAKQPVKTLHQMLDANWESKEKDLLERTPQEFFDALPEELQYAAKYVMNGGTDMKGLFSALSRVEQVKAMDITTEDGQVATARNYLQAIQFGTPEEIEDEVAAWKSGNRLEKKAKEIKPKLDAMYKEQIEYQTQQEAKRTKQQQAAAQAYIGNVNKAFEKNDLNGIKLDKKTAGTLYTGLTTVNYPSASGKPTNLLGHLLDKIQYVEPDFALLAEVTYLLNDPAGYRAALKQLGKNEQVVDTVKKLKTEQQTGGVGGSGTAADDDPGTTTTKKKLSKPRSVLDGWS